LSEHEHAPDSLELQIQSAISGKYKIRREVGKGGMAVVYEAEDLALDRRVALKFLLPDFAQDDEVLERFRREGVVASKLEHPAIVPIYSIARADRFWYIVMKFIDGQNLKQILRQEGKLSLQDAIGYLAPIAEALDYAHENGVVHRDIKSSNFLISKSNRPYLSDFGIAKAVDTMTVTRTGSIVGTPEYMSPEQADGKVCDHRADLYSLAVVAYEALFGSPPFKGETPFATALKHLREDPTFPSSAPSDLVSILRKGLSKSPGKRYQTAAAMIRDLEGLSIARASREKERTPTPRKVIPREITPRPLPVEKEATPVSRAEDKSPVPPKKRANLTFVIVGAFIVFVIIMMLLPDSSSRNPVSRTEGTPRVPPMTSEGERAVSSKSDTARRVGRQESEGKLQAEAQAKETAVGRVKEELVLNITATLQNPGRLRAYIIPTVDAQYGAIDCIKDAAGNFVLKIGDRTADGTDLAFTSPAYVKNNSVVKPLTLPTRARFSRVGGYMIVVIDYEAAGDGAIVGFKPFDVTENGEVANFDGMEFEGNQKIVSFTISE
jgi:serine/threonine protein kinase